jgi:hypothetical protein
MKKDEIKVALGELRTKLLDSVEEVQDEGEGRRARVDDAQHLPASR